MQIDGVHRASLWIHKCRSDSAHKTLFLGDMVDCVMDGLQNRTQLQNKTYRDMVRSFCGLFSIPPNFANLNQISNDLYMRTEPRNQTFIESMDYLLAKVNEKFDLKFHFYILGLFLVFQVKLFFLNILIIEEFDLFTTPIRTSLN